MRRTIYTYPRTYGGTDVVTQGPIGRGLGVVRLAMLAFVGIAMIVALFTGQWSAAGVLFLLFALLTPNLRKQAKLRAQLRDGASPEAKAVPASASDGGFATGSQPPTDGVAVNWLGSASSTAAYVGGEPYRSAPRMTKSAASSRGPGKGRPASDDSYAARPFASLRRGLNTAPGSHFGPKLRSNVSGKVRPVRESEIATRS